MDLPGLQDAQESLCPEKVIPACKKRGLAMPALFFYVPVVAYSATEEVSVSEATLESSVAAALESSAAALESSVAAALDSSTTVEEVLVVEVSVVELVELLLLPEQAARLATIARAIIATRIFFMMSFPF